MQLSIDPAPPASTFGAAAQPLGPVLRVNHTAPIDGSQVRLPVDLAIFDRTTGISADQQRDAFLAIFNERLSMWLPLPTELDRATSSLVAVAPHFSLIGSFWAKATSVAREVGHDVQAGLRIAWDTVSQTVDDWFNGESKKPECGAVLPDWSVTSNEPNVTGCAVTTDGSTAIRLGNGVRIPYDIALPAKFGIGFTEYDTDVKPTTLLLKALNRPLHTLVIGARGRGQYDLSQSPQPTTELTMQPDQLGLALDVILAMLNWIPGTKAFSEELTAKASLEIWELGAKHLSVTQLFVELRTIVQREVSKPDALEVAEIWADASSCAAAAFQAGGGADMEDAKKWVGSAVRLGKECLSTALKAAGSGLEELWNIIKTVPESFRSLGQIGDALRVSFTHFGGKLTVTISHQEPHPVAEADWPHVVAGDVDCSVPGLGVELRWPPRSYDITGDGVPDTFVPVECYTGDASSDTQLEVFDGTSDAASPRRIGVLTRLYNPRSPIDYPFAIEKIRVNDVVFSGRSVTMSGDACTASDCLHCPSFAFTQVATWNGTSFSMDAMQVTRR